MATIKKYNGSTWENTTARKYETKSEIITPPTTIYADGSNITTYTIKGNTVQNGTPTPQNPVMPNGTGVRTAQLFDISAYIRNSVPTRCTISQTIGDGLEITATGNDPYTNTVCVNGATLGSEYRSACIDVQPSTTYTLSASVLSKCFVSFLNDNFVAVKNFATIPANATSYTFTTDTSTSKILIRFGADILTGQIAIIDNIMFNEGTAKPHEPYGYKIPISNGQQTTNIYLGSTQTTRRIKKIVLTGEETDWTLQSINSHNIANFGLSMPEAYRDYQSNVFIFSSHYVQQTTGIADTETVGITIDGTFPSHVLYVRENATNYANATAFKQYLAAQYANGTPVTVWYILVTAETAAVNEPLMKIGTYADTLSNATAIPTTQGANSITVDTTVQPSEFTATWTGWHDTTVKEKSENLFDYETMLDGKTSYFLDASGSEISNPYWSITKYIPVDGTVFTLARTFGGTSPAICLYDSNKNFITGVSYQGEQIVTISSNSNAAYIRFSYYINESGEDVAHDMLNEGSTAFPYEPYWK